MRIVAILDTMWGDREGRATRFFRINPSNFSGRRLYKWVGEENVSNLFVTNACKELVTDPKHHGKPDPEWLAENLRRLHPDLVLVCGNIAQRAFYASEVHSDETLKFKWMFTPHP